MPTDPQAPLRCAYNELCDLVAGLDRRLAALEQAGLDAAGNYRQRWNTAARASATYRNALIEIAETAYASALAVHPMTAEENATAAAFTRIANQARAALTAEHAPPAAPAPRTTYSYDPAAIPETFDDWATWADTHDARSLFDAWTAATARAQALAQDYLNAYALDVFPEPPAGQHAATVDGCGARALRRVLTKLVAAL